MPLTYTPSGVTTVGTVPISLGDPAPTDWSWLWSGVFDKNQLTSGSFPAMLDAGLYKVMITTPVLVPAGVISSLTSALVPIAGAVGVEIENVVSQGNTIAARIRLPGRQAGEAILNFLRRLIALLQSLLVLAGIGSFGVEFYKAGGPQQAAQLATDVLKLGDTTTQTINKASDTGGLIILLVAAVFALSFLRR